MNLLFRWCFLALIAVSFSACEKDDDETSTNTQTVNDPIDPIDPNIQGAFISGDVEGVNKVYPVISYSTAISGFVQALAADTTGAVPIGDRVLSVTFRPILGLGTHSLQNGTILEAIVTVNIEDTTRNGGRFQTANCKDFNGQAAYNSVIAFSKLDTVSGEVEGTFNAMAYQGANCIVTDSVLITNGRFRFDYK